MWHIARHSIVEGMRIAIKKAKEDGVLPLDTVLDITVEHPQNPQNGDFATSLPLRLARATSIQPLELAQQLIKYIPETQEVQRVWVAPPGFINFLLSEDWLKAQVDVIRETGKEYGTVNLGSGQRVMVEYVSINPTGPLHHGHAWGAVLGSTLVNVLIASGYSVTAEYYVNDAGSQMESFYRSLYVRYLQALGQEAQLAQDGYQGAYIIDTVEKIISEDGDRFLNMAYQEAVAELGKVGLGKMVDLINIDLENIGVKFDVWFKERDLYDNGEYDDVMEILRQAGFLIEREGALWFASTSLGEDKDNVIVRSNGTPTYFASDIAYHHNKFIKRGFPTVINIVGADHQGHVSRMKAAVSALGIDPKRLKFIITQMVSLKRGTETVKASKRSGEFITLRELIEEVGSDACRYFFLSRTPDSQMSFDLELAKKQSSENPVYYVQYAHARISGILRNAREMGIEWNQGDVSLLKDPNELALLRKMVYLPELVESMARLLEPHHLPHYSLELATAFHWFYENCRVISSISSDSELTLARLKLVEAAQIVLAKVLHIMGMGAPQEM